MDDAELVQVLNPERNLVSDVGSSALHEGEATRLQVLEQVLALHVVEDDVVRVAVLEQIDQSDDVVVLAHLQHLDLSPLLDYLNRLHIFLLHRLDGNLLFAHFVRGLFD